MENAPRLPKNFTLIYGVLMVIQLISVFFRESVPIFHFISKPTLLSSLIIFLLIQTQGKRNSFVWLMLVSLFFSLMGDIFLMIPGDKPIFFICGLASFLLTHIGYTFIFAKSPKRYDVPSLLSRKPWMSIGFLLYGGAIFSFIFPTLSQEGMVAPVALYTSAIIIMALIALNRWKRYSNPSFSFIFFGALLFVLSDSMIAINKFAFPIPLQKFWIMLTYIVAQYLIVIGFIKQLKETES